jgi:hypothetical protein
MNKEIEMIKDKYRPQIDRLKQISEDLLHRQARHQVKSKKEEDKNSFTKIKSAIESTQPGPRGSGLNPPQFRKQP